MAGGLPDSGPRFNGDAAGRAPEVWTCFDRLTIMAWAGGCGIPIMSPLSAIYVLLNMVDDTAMEGITNYMRELLDDPDVEDIRIVVGRRSDEKTTAD